jgi:hypothetical protein
MEMSLNLNMVSESTRRRGEQNNPARHTAAGYAAVYPSAKGKIALEQAIAKSGLDTNFDMKELHVTLMYDKSNPKLFHPATPGLVYMARVVGADLFGDDQNTLVLKLDCAALQQRHQYLLSVGYRFSYPDYKPHLTIKIPAGQDDLNTINAAITAGMFDQEIELGDEQWSPIKEDVYAKYEEDEDDGAAA